MIYREFGKTGVKVSALGLGCMRLPCMMKDDKWVVNEEEAIKMIHRASELGVNYIDTAYGYHDGQSEIVVGKALKNGYREKFNLSTKLPPWEIKKESDVRRLLEEQLKKLDTDYIDFYHIHALNEGTWNDIVLKYGVLEKMQQFKEEGLIKHISFSFHDSVECMKKIIDTGVFETVLCQYNVLDQSLEEGFTYAHEKGLGTTIMGPVAGGRLATPMGNSILTKAMNGKASNSYEVALRFVLGNQNVSCALSGMSSIEQLEANVKVASIEDPFSKDEWESFDKMIKQTQNMRDLYCTGCNYCNVCPKNIKIPEVFKFMNFHKVFGLTEMAKAEYAKLGKEEWLGANPKECIECGLCETKCPQNINIREKLKEVESELGAK